MIEKKYLKINDATLGYEDNIIFKDLNVQFECGKITAILGKSGCGKSTVLRTLAGLLKPIHGDVVYINESINKPHKDICMMHQKYVNFPWMNCIDNVLIARHDDEDYKPSKKIDPKEIKQTEAYKILEQVGLQDYAFRFPHELSGGMNQRLSLARVIYRKPRVILMDEPLSALDPKTRLDMQNLLLDLHYKTNNTIIMVTHDPDEAKKMCHNIVNL